MTNSEYQNVNYGYPPYRMVSDQPQASHRVSTDSIAKASALDAKESLRKIFEAMDPQQSTIDSRDPIEKLNCSERFNKSKYNFNHMSHQVEFKSKERHFGSERAELIPTVEKAIIQFSKKINYLQDQIDRVNKQLASRRTSSSELVSLSKQLKTLEQQLGLYQTFKKEAETKFNDPTDTYRTWLTSQFFDEKLNLDVPDYEKRVASYFPGLINLNYHEYIKGDPADGKGDPADGTVGFARCGAITDFSNPMTNLQELREWSEEWSNSLSARDKFLTEHRNVKDSPPSQPKQRVDYARTINLEQVIAKREAYLNEQMLQLIETQVEKNLASLDLDQPFRLFHLGLMNETNTDGKTFHEGNFIRDMQTIFGDFNSKTLIFDGEGPYVDAEGNIHLSHHREGKKVVLETYFANVSVQGALKDDSLQDECNQTTLDAFTRLAPAKLKLRIDDLKAKLAKGKSNSEVARDFLKLALDLGIISSTGCRKGKDRTGVVSGLVTRACLYDDIDNSTLTEAEKTKLKDKFGNTLLDKDSVASWVVWNNTKIVVLKVTEFLITGVSSVNRMKYYFKQMSIVADMAVTGLKKKIPNPSKTVKNFAEGITKFFQEQFKPKIKSRVETAAGRILRFSKKIFNSFKS